MGRKLVAILLMLGSYAQAQNTKYKKAEKFYQKGKIDKCISTTIKLKKKYPKSVEVYYYLSISYFEKYKNEKKYFLLTKSLNYLNAGLKKNNSSIDLTDERIERIHQELVVQANKKYDENTKNAKKQYNQLAYLFKDTTAQYYELNEIIKKEKVVNDSFPPGRINRQYMLAVAEI